MLAALIEDMIIRRTTDTRDRHFERGVPIGIFRTGIYFIPIIGIRFKISIDLPQRYFRIVGIGAAVLGIIDRLQAIAAKKDAGGSVGISESPGSLVLQASERRFTIGCTAVQTKMIDAARHHLIGSVAPIISGILRPIDAAI